MVEWKNMLRMKFQAYTANSGTSNRDVSAGFASAVDNAIRSSSGGGALRPFPKHGFASIVDNAIRSGSGRGALRPFPEHDFASTVDNAITSGSGRGNLPPFPEHGFASTVDNAIKSGSGGGDLRPFPVQDFASGVDNVKGDVEDFQLFTVAELVAATNNFSLDNKMMGGVIPFTYRGKLVDGREVAIKRDLFLWRRTSDLAFLSRLHHKNLIGLVGFCEGKHRMLLVYEYMKNGSLYDHLHGKDSSVLNSCKMRIKIALDASRGIEYLHNYAVPSIIHRNIKSSNILLDATWTARVSDFELLFMHDFQKLEVVGTPEYIAPEYLRLNVVTAKNDVYWFGVVLLEILTGKEPTIYGSHSGMVEFAVPAILTGDLAKILDPRVGPPDVNEAEALELLAHTAIHCVKTKGKDM